MPKQIREAVTAEKERFEDCLVCYVENIYNQVGHSMNCRLAEEHAGKFFCRIWRISEGFACGLKVTVQPYGTAKSIIAPRLLDAVVCDFAGATSGFGDKAEERIKVEVKETVKKLFMVFILLTGLLAAGWILFAAVFFLVERARAEESNQNIQIRTETEPIYNHFPDLPETPEIQWCSRSSGGIGLTTAKLYFFAFYDSDVSGKLQDMTIESRVGELELYFIPDGINGDEKWRKVESEGNAFPLQTGVRESARFYADVYINEAGTVLYVEATGG